MSNVADVVFLPWVHRLNSIVHQRLLEYVERLPKNSIVALETLDNELFSDEVRHKELSRYTPERLSVALKKTEATTTILASYEIQNACRRRNISIIPIESPVLMKRMHKIAQEMNRSGVEKTILEYERVNQAREEQVAEKIAQAAVGKKRVYVIIGAKHIPLVQHLLQNKDVRTRVEQSILGASRTDEFLKLERRIRQAAQNRDAKRATQLFKSQQWEENDPLTSIMRLKTAIEAAKTKSETRLQRRLQASRRRRRI